MQKSSSLVQLCQVSIGTRIDTPGCSYPITSNHTRMSRAQCLVTSVLLLRLLLQLLPLSMASTEIRWPRRLNGNSAEAKETIDNWSQAGIITLRRELHDARKEMQRLLAGAKLSSVEHQNNTRLRDCLSHNVVHDISGAEALGKPLRSTVSTITTATAAAAAAAAAATTQVKAINHSAGWPDDCPPKLNGTCMFTQVGHDGLGHQIEGKLSCIATSLHIPQLKYVHTPFRKVQHAGPGANTSELAIAYERLFELGRCAEARDPRFPAETIKNIHIRFKKTEGWHERIRTGEEKCNPGIVYEMDNCWDWIYRQKRVGFFIDAMPYWQSTFHSEKNASVLNSPNRTNIAVHYRAGDRSGLVPMKYFTNAIQELRKEYRNTSKPAKIVVHTNAEGPPCRLSTRCSTALLRRFHHEVWNTSISWTKVK